MQLTLKNGEVKKVSKRMAKTIEPEDLSVIKFASVTEPDPEDPMDIPESKYTTTTYKPP